MGTEGGLSERLLPEDERKFPNLQRIGYRVTSPKDKRYNCIAHAAGDFSKKWDPGMIPLPGYYWPPGADRGGGINALLSAFESLGYEVCGGGDHEPGYEKVALYVDKIGRWQHAARQEPNGEWSSKLGNEEDIRHRQPHCFGGSEYGEVMHFMRRAVSGEIHEEKEKG